ncbi:sugar 3,4-ketoisomerase [Herbaspirillum sp. NPDC087042]|uniref:sugar 3,4-ketoisomerase n=1 Tax=Herbaspirillum sp. NPDC087042 TaxID=3364004 RepID=UPI0038259FB8
MSHFTMLSLPTFSDERGSLTVLEAALPFQVVRTYWIYGADDQTRGGHRHSHTRQALVALNGKVSIYMNDGITEETVELSNPGQCLLVEPKDWHTMTFGAGAVLLVMSSHTYDRSEYIDTPYERGVND